MRRRLACSPTSTPARPAARARRRRAERGRARLPGAASAATTCPAPGARSTTSGFSSSRCRCSPAGPASGWRWPDERVSGAAQRRRPGGVPSWSRACDGRQASAGRRTAPRPAEPGAGRCEESCDLCGKPDPREAQPPPPSDRAPDPLRLRELHGAALRRPRASPDGHRVLWLDDFELSDELWARLAIPIGLAFFLRSARRAASSPSTRAPPGRPSPSWIWTRGRS